MSVMFNADTSSSSLPYIIKLTAGKRSTGMDTDSSIATNTNMNTEPNMDIFNEADEKEKKWWSGKGSLGSLGIDEKRLPLVLARGVKFNQFAKRAEKIKARRFLDYRNGTIAIIELPTGGHEVTAREFSFKFMTAICNATNQRSVYDWGSKSLFTNLPTDEYQEPDACFIPIRLLDALNPVLNPCDRDGSPWPTIILEVASSETLQHVKDKINNYWLVQDRCEDVIVIKIGNWEEKRRNQTTQRPLRRLRQNPNATTFEAIEEIEFGSTYANGRESNFCTGPHMKWLTINCNCIYAGCPQPPPLPSFYTFISSRPFSSPRFPYPLQAPGVAMDVYDLQQAIFSAMGHN
ncbi:16184_t:CDS:2 [Funneliformis caledonium]|uniref:16184_t:CDS:1 n=1 Tax=Funneliformis caledonium TaxID=1117310 RepID=A0A9N9HWW4_9GLOM|nr:16184_t:CDS:2 [Funneliformis caledonium]